MVSRNGLGKCQAVGEKGGVKEERVREACAFNNMKLIMLLPSTRNAYATFVHLPALTTEPAAAYQQHSY